MRAKKWVALVLALLLLPVPHIYAQAEQWLVEDTFSGVYLEEFTGNPRTITLGSWDMLNISNRGNANFNYFRVEAQPDGYLSFGRQGNPSYYGMGAQRVIGEDAVADSGRYVMELDVRMDFPEVTGGNHGAYTDFSVYGMVNGAEKKLLTLTRNNMDDSNPSAMKESPNPTDLYVNADPTGKIVIPNMDSQSWYKLRFEMNLADGLYDIYVNDAEIPVIAACAMDAKGAARISKVDFITGATGKGSSNLPGLFGVDVDNFRLGALPAAGSDTIAQDIRRLQSLDIAMLREDVNLPARLSAIGASMTWTSENPAVRISASAADNRYTAQITRPAFGQPDAAGDFIVTLSAGGQQETVRIPVTVPAGTADSDVVMADLEKLALDGMQYTEAFVLPAEGEGGTKLEWQSDSAAAQIGAAGADGVPVSVVRPGEEESDAQVTLTARASYGDFSLEKQYRITILKLPFLTDAEKLAEDTRLLQLESDVVGDSFTVSAAGMQYGSKITWSASPAGIVTWGEPQNGRYTAVVKRGDTTVTLTVTATLERSGETKTKSFTVRVLKQEDSGNDKAKRDADTLTLGKTDAINADFTLPSFGSVYGSAVAWSSNSPYLHISQTAERYVTVQVTQPPQKTEAVLTATVTNGMQTVKRDFGVTLVPRYSMETTHCMVSDDFDGNKYINPGDLLGTQTLADWTMVNGSNRPKGNLYFQIDTEGNNGVLRMERTENYYSIYAYREFLTTAGRNVDMKLRAKIDAESQKGVRVYLAVYGRLQNGAEVLLARMVKRHDDPALRLIRADESPLTDANGNAVVIQACAADSWYDFHWKMNTETHTYDLYVNNQLTLQTAPFLGQAVQISKIQMEIPNTKNEIPQLTGGGGVQIDYFNVEETATPAVAVQEELAALTLPEVATRNLDLPVCGSVHGANITWSSSAPDVLSGTGAVYREPSDGTDRTVQLTASISSADGTITQTRAFTVLVPKMQTNAEMAAVDLALAHPPAKAYFDIVLPQAGLQNGSEIFWSSTDASVIGSDGSVKRGTEEKRVILTAEVICASDPHSAIDTRKKSFEVIVPARAEAIPEVETLAPDRVPWWGSSELAAQDILLTQDGIRVGGSLGAYAIRDVPIAKSGFVATWSAAAKTGLLQMRLYGEGEELLTLTLGGGKLSDGNGNPLAFGITDDSAVTISLEGNLRDKTAAFTVCQNESTLAAGTLSLTGSSLVSIAFGGVSGTKTDASISGVTCYPTYTYEVAQDLAAVTITDKQTVTKDFPLPAAGAQYGTAFTWESSKPSVIRIEDGTAVVTRPKSGFDAVVLLTLTATQGRTTAQQQYTITVSPESPIQTGGGGGGGGSSGKNRGTTQILPPAVTDMEPQNEAPFADLGDAAWANNYIVELYKLGVISGREEGRFYPNDAITREEYVKLLISGLGFTEQEGDGTFTDAEPDAWYEPYLDTAKVFGIVNGRPDGSFGIGEQISRADMAVMAARAMAARGMTLMPFEGSPFADDKQIAAYAKEDVYRMAGAGIINGTGGNVFEPDSPATRAQAAKIIYQILEK